MTNVESAKKAQPHKTTFQYYRVNKVLIGEFIALHLIYGFWCIFALFTHASSLNLVIFQSGIVTSFQYKPIKQRRCWHMRRDMRGRINHVPQNVYEEGRSSAKLEGKRQREGGREQRHGHNDGWVRCGFTALPTYALLHPHPAEVGTKLTARAVGQQQV